MNACARFFGSAPASARWSSKTFAPKFAGWAAIPRTMDRSSATHQRFEDLKAAVTGGDEKSIINEVERGEDYLKAKFETALNGHVERRMPRQSSSALSVGPIGP